MQKQNSYLEKQHLFAAVFLLITFVTTMMVNTSPLLKGRSCSEVPLKLYLATHSVPCGQGAWQKGGRITMSEHVRQKIISYHATAPVDAHMGM